MRTVLTNVAVSVSVSKITRFIVTMTTGRIPRVSAAGRGTQTAESKTKNALGSSRIRNSRGNSFRSDLRSRHAPGARGRSGLKPIEERLKRVRCAWARGKNQDELCSLIMNRARLKSELRTPGGMIPPGIRLCGSLEMKPNGNLLGGFVDWIWWYCVKSHRKRMILVICSKTL
jgi:hypothetical protein